MMREGEEEGEEKGERLTHVAPTDGEIRREEEEDGCHDYIGDAQLLRYCQWLLWGLFRVDDFERTRLQNQPNGPGRLKGLGGSILRPRRQFIAGGIA